MNLAPHERASELDRIKAACISEGHHFLSLTGEYHEAVWWISRNELCVVSASIVQDHHDEEEIKHFLEQIDSHRHVKAKPKKKDKDKDKDKVGFAVIIVKYVASNLISALFAEG